ncbi:hypothetical protein JHD50_09375 [Sulfurimonas sp. MAG313]|nr:hypothetical protein [Sulfurimonas sp. MAG313]MDF1881508.1 hypothetical protein [Sulfurimonas sp. MAG313]
MSYPLAYAKKLLELVDKKTLNGSAFKNKKLLNELKDFGIVHIVYKGQRSKINLLCESKLNILLEENYDIGSLQSYIQVSENKNRTRADISEVSGGSKSLSTQVQAGLYLAAYEGINIKIDGQKTVLYTTDKSSFFVHDNAQLEFSDDILIVGVENFENITYIQKQKKLFNDGRKKIFVWRNKYARKFIENCVNEYLHYGDFDLAGINIFLNEIVPRLRHEKYKFFIPENIKDLLTHGNSNDYFMHNHKYPNLRAKERYLQDFIDLIHKKKRSLHQEYLINQV